MKFDKNINTKFKRKMKKKTIHMIKNFSCNEILAIKIRNRERRVQHFGILFNFFLTLKLNKTGNLFYSGLYDKMYACTKILYVYDDN